MCSGWLCELSARPVISYPQDDLEVSPEAFNQVIPDASLPEGDPFLVRGGYCEFLGLPDSSMAMRLWEVALFGEHALGPGTTREATARIRAHPRYPWSKDLREIGGWPIRGSWGAR
jgi:hypothetical protein